MSYATYTTDALVCGSWKRNTADGSFLLFTREAGMLYAEARSVREERSKQRYALQDFSLIRVSLVKGKRGWKIGSVESKQNFFSEAASKEARGSVVSIFKFLRRFLKGEEQMVELYDFVTAALPLLSSDTENRELLERVVEIHILLALGYVDGKEVPPFLRDSDLPTLAQIETAPEIPLLERLIQKAVSTSHL